MLKLFVTSSYDHVGLRLNTKRFGQNQQISYHFTDPSFKILNFPQYLLDVNWQFPEKHHIFQIFTEYREMVQIQWKNIQKKR